MLGLFNSITILIIIHVVLLRVLGIKTPSILSCGLFGYIASRNKNNFSWDKFNALGIDNDERGGDSIGRAVGNDIRKFVSKKATTTYKDYVINHKNGERHHIALGHTRKASVGLISVETAQPVVIDLPNGEGKFIMVHNGTLHNWEDLAKKYGINKFGKSDSMVLGEIIYQHGFDVLLEYNGAAALIIRDDRFPDTLMVYRGKSKNYLHKAEDERPLYYYQERKNSMYISSREEGLYFIGGEVDSVEEFEPNYLYTIHEGAIVSRLSYDRSNCSQVKIWSTTTNYGSHYNTKKYNQDIEAYYEEAYAEYDDSNVYSRGNGKLPAVDTTVDKEYIIRQEAIIKPVNPQRIVCSRFRYYFFDKKGSYSLAVGGINLDENGFRNDGKRVPYDKVYYFYAGIMMKDKNAYRTAIATFGKSSRFIDTDQNITKICLLAAHPVCTVEHVKPSYSNLKAPHTYYSNIKQEKVTDGMYFSGTFTMLFGKKEYRCVGGSIREIKELSTARRPVHFEEDVKTAVQASMFEEKGLVVVKGFTKKADIEPKSDEVGSPFIGVAKSGSEENLANIDKILEEAGISPTSQSEDDDDQMVSTLEAQSEQVLTEEEQLKNEEVNKALDEGLQSMLMALDETTASVEIIGAKDEESLLILQNLYNLQELLLEREKIKNQTIIVGYDNEF